MQRYFVNNEQVKNNNIYITGEDYHHISRVMRMKQGDHIICVTPDEQSALCEIGEITNEHVMVNILQWNHQSTELPVQITIASGLPKGDKLEWMMQKGTELGAYEFIPFFAARSITKWDNKKIQKRVERLQKIVKEAAEQSHRFYMPKVRLPVTVKELVQLSQLYDYKIVAFEEDAKKGERSNFAKLLQAMRQGETLIIVFGPEGGLTQEEVQLFEKNGFQSCGLGPRILRTETAPLYALAAASYQLELMR